jgi:hypothetical protein
MNFVFNEKKINHMSWHNILYMAFGNEYFRGKKILKCAKNKKYVYIIKMKNGLKLMISINKDLRIMNI